MHAGVAHVAWKCQLCNKAHNKLLLLHRVRISLGLKPLSMENSADSKRKEFDAGPKLQAEQEKEAQTAALLERVQKYVTLTFGLCLEWHICLC